jgi:hypothetical protein
MTQVGPKWDPSGTSAGRPVLAGWCCCSRAGAVGVEPKQTHATPAPPALATPAADQTCRGPVATRRVDPDGGRN